MGRHHSANNITMINIKTLLCFSLLLVLCFHQVEAATEKAVNLPAGGKEGVNFASQEDMDKADAKGSGMRLEQSLVMSVVAAVGMLLRSVALSVVWNWGPLILFSYYSECHG